jgi:hypothetical protein
MNFSANFYLTVLAFFFGIGVVAFSNFVERRRRKTFTAGLLPTLPFMFAGVIVALLAIAHFITLFRGYR